MQSTIVWWFITLPILADIASSSSPLLTHSTLSWAEKFVSENNLYALVPNEFMTDSFNLVGLPDVPHQQAALELIVGSAQDDSFSEEVECSAQALFGLIHARYICSTPGLAAMCMKHDAGDFGRCPRVLCSGQSLFPCGMSDALGAGTVKGWCPRCCDLYELGKDYDGAHWGTSFCHLYRFCKGKEAQLDMADVGKNIAAKYVPRLFGFKCLTASPS
jgi:casein kinase II subunit beta